MLAFSTLSASLSLGFTSPVGRLPDHVIIRVARGAFLVGQVNFTLQVLKDERYVSNKCQYHGVMFGLNAYVCAVKVLKGDHFGVDIVTVSTCPKLSDDVVNNGGCYDFALLRFERRYSFVPYMLIDWNAAVTDVQVEAQKELNLFDQICCAAALRVQDMLQSYNNYMSLSSHASINTILPSRQCRTVPCPRTWL